MNQTNLECLFLSEEDLREVGSLDMHKCVDVMESAMKLVGTGDYLMGGPSQNEHGQKLFFPLESKFPNMPIAGPDRRFMTLIAYLGGDFNVAGMKWYGSNPGNGSKGLPRSILMTVLNDPDTGAPLAMMAANTISAMRTGAQVGLASKYLSNSKAEIIGLIGAGVISKTSLMGLAAANKQIKEVKVFDIKQEQSRAFAEKMGQKLGLKISIVDSLEDVVTGSDIVNAAGSGAKKPYIKAEWLKKGALVTLPGSVDLEEKIFQDSKLVVDEWKMHLAYYEQNRMIPKDDPRRFSTSYLFEMIERGVLNESSIMSLGPIVTTGQSIRNNDEEKYIFVTGGMPVQDVAWSHYLYQEAKEAGKGHKLNFWNDVPSL